MTLSADLTINLKSIAHNWLLLKAKLSSGVDCGAVVKADAYGVGMESVVGALLKVGCRSFYVSRLSEALAVRSVLVGLEDTLGVRVSESRIYALAGCAPGDEIDFIRHRLIPVLISAEMISRWREALKKAGMRAGSVPSVIKLDTGMGRLGLESVELEAVLAQPLALEQSGVLMIMSHLACADEPEHRHNHSQLREFKEALRRFREILPSVRASLANSAGIFLGEDYHFDAVRPGIALYGGNPQPAFDNQVLQVVNLHLPILQLKNLPSGAFVGYGASYQFDSPARVAVIAGGYADGLMRSLSGRGECWVSSPVSPGDGWRVPVVGRISMDSFVVDVTFVPEGVVQVGARLEVIGGHILLDEVATWAGTSSYEILTSLGARYQRNYLT